MVQNLWIWAVNLNPLHSSGHLHNGENRFHAQALLPSVHIEEFVMKDTVHGIADDCTNIECSSSAPRYCKNCLVAVCVLCALPHNKNLLPFQLSIKRRCCLKSHLWNKSKGIFLLSFQTTVKWFQIDLPTANLCPRRWFIPTHPRALNATKYFFFLSWCLQFYPHHRTVIAEKCINMSATSSILLISICSVSLFLSPKPLQQMLPFHIRAGKISFFHMLFPSHCTCGSVSAITFVAELQMSLWLSATDHTFFFKSQEWVCKGVHTHDIKAEADVHTWIRMSQQVCQVWPTQMPQNTSKMYLLICVMFFFCQGNRYSNTLTLIISTTVYYNHQYGSLGYRKIEMRLFNSWLLALLQRKNANMNHFFTAYSFMSSHTPTLPRPPHMPDTEIYVLVFSFYTQGEELAYLSSIRSSKARKFALHRHKDGRWQFGLSLILQYAGAVMGLFAAFQGLSAWWHMWAARASLTEPSLFIMQFIMGIRSHCRVAENSPLY